MFQIAFGQKDTVLYYKGNNKPSFEFNATRYVKIKHKKRGVYKVERFIKKDKKWVETEVKETVIVTSDTSLIIKTSSRYKKEELINRIYKKIGGGFIFKDFYKNGKLKQAGATTSFYPLHIEGKMATFYKSGNVESICFYKNNQMVSNKNWLESGEVYVDNIFKDVDIWPQYPGGKMALNRDIAKSVRYPVTAMKNRLTGRVFVHFVVNEEGEISNVYVDSIGNWDLDKEAYRVVTSLKKKWSPGILDGKKVKVAFVIPINFMLN